MDRTAPKATPSSTPQLGTPSQAGRLRPDQMEVFDGLLLALLARKRLLLLVGDAGSGRAAVFRQLVEQVESDGALVLPVSASPGAQVEDLVGSAGDAVLPSDNGERDFDTLIEELEERLDLAGAGLLAVENAGVLTPPVLGDLIDLTRSETAGGRFLQVLLCGTPEMERSLARPGLAEAVRELGVIYRMTPGAGPSVTPSAQPPGMGNGIGAPAAMRPIGPPPQPAPPQPAPQEPPREPTRRELRAPAPAPERINDPRVNDPRTADPRTADPRTNDWPANDWDAPDGWTIPEAGSPLASDMPVAPPRRRHAALAGAAITTLILLGAAGAAVTLAVPGASPEKALDAARQGWTDLRAFVTEHVGNPLSDTGTTTATRDPARDPARDPDAVALARVQNPATAPDNRTVPAKGNAPVRSDAPSAALPPGMASGTGSQVAALDPASVAPSHSAPPPVAKPELPPLAPTITAPRVLPPPSDPLSAEPPPPKPRADQGEGPTSGSATLPPLVDEGPSAAATQGAAPAPAAPLPTDGDAGLTQRVRGLVDQARRQIIAKRLTTPPGDNAYETVSRLREVAPTTPEIGELLGTMEETYRRWAAMAERDNDFDEAKRFYERALIVAPSNGDLRERIKAASEHRVSPAVPAAPATATAGAPTTTTVANQPPSLDSRDSALSLLRRPDELKRLLDGGADANKRVDNGKTLLMLASEQGLADAVKVLVDHRARTELRTADGATAVMYAAWGGHEAVVQALAAAGAELDATNDDGKTALMAASARGHMGVVRALLDRGIAVDRVASHGWSALMYAANNGHDRVAKLLVERGANPFRMDTAGNSALTLGALQGHMQVVEALKPR
ncbi:ankyrin repeat domain-containing protein [Azospirillum rugosum]|uniref:ORC1/DEAH AAA+ ATPase domain-containing protein n=1 Tax=Azospirillum rugosum TaxID=416170 RepID=A0ABS4SQG5_9PROT|nr:ankyrin repeat domain-containing protein [Azospirillum rugosum]MBP2294796.1 hypothetical protein [Azospirillum rugosum]MDQ0528282.1 hypothetical protein [Azospirillum rugosum]